MAMGTERSKSLHNFMMPCELRWGNQRFLRCMKVNSDGKISPLHRFTPNNSDQHHNYNNSIHQPRTTRDREKGREIDSSSEFLHGSHKVGPTPQPASSGGWRFSDDDDGIVAMREKVMFDLQIAADKIKDTIFKDRLEKGEFSGPPPPRPVSAVPSVEVELSRPWNLRTRRATFKTSASRFVSSTNGDVAAAAGGEKESAVGKRLMVDAPKPNSGVSQMKTGLVSVGDKSPRLRSGGSSAAASGETKKRPKFAVALSKRDIEEDFHSMVGHRPPRRPKKRAKIVQRQLDILFPGLWLTEVTPGMYKVFDVAP